MKISYRLAVVSEINICFNLLKLAATRLQSNKINQWQYWLNPTEEKIQWIKDGFLKKEFNFILHGDAIIGMFRLLHEDKLYWGETSGVSNYIHSFVVIDEFVGKHIGSNVLKDVINKTKVDGIPFFRLDCNASNQNLCNYYEKIGFIKVGEILMPHSLNNLYQIDLINY